MNASNKEQIEMNASAFKKEWKAVAKDHPDFAKAYAMQQAVMISQHLTFGKSICDMARRGQILITVEMFEKYCGFLTHIEDIETELTKFIDCISGPHPDRCL